MIELIPEIMLAFLVVVPLVAVTIGIIKDAFKS